MLEMQCDCQEAEAAFMTFLQTGELTDIAACYYSETADLEPQVLYMYNDCIGNIDVESLPYAECTYCDFSGYYIDGSEELTNDEWIYFRYEVCLVDDHKVFPEENVALS